MMAVFPNGVEDAIKAGISKSQAVHAYNEHRIADSYQPITVGIGIHVGHMMVGMVGETNRMQGDAFSDNVNLTARIEGLTKYYSVSMIVSGEVVQRIEEKTNYGLRFLDRVVVKGRNTPLDIYEVLDGLSDEEQTLKLQTLADFKAGIAAYQEQDFEQAKTYFEQVLSINPTDKTAHLYTIRIDELLEKGVPEDWDGFTWMMKK